jgi:predicted transcriptional regulator
MKVLLEVEKEKADILLDFLDKNDFVKVISFFDNYEMSEKEINAVSEGLEQVKKGDVISHKDVMEETSKRYPNLFIDGSLV